MGANGLDEYWVPEHVKGYLRKLIRLSWLNKTIRLAGERLEPAQTREEFGASGPSW